MSHGPCFSDGGGTGLQDRTNKGFLHRLYLFDIELVCYALRPLLFTATGAGKLPSALLRAKSSLPSMVAFPTDLTSEIPAPPEADTHAQGATVQHGTLKARTKHPPSMG